LNFFVIRVFFTLFICFPFLQSFSLSLLRDRAGGSFPCTAWRIYHPDGCASRKEASPTT